MDEKKEWLLPSQELKHAEDYGALFARSRAFAAVLKDCPLDSAPARLAAVVLAGRSFANVFRTRAQRLWLNVPDQDLGPTLEHHRLMLSRADQEVEQSRRWGALAKTLAERPSFSP